MPGLVRRAARALAAVRARVDCGHFPSLGWHRLTRQRRSLRCHRYLYVHLCRQWAWHQVQSSWLPTAAVYLRRVSPSHAP